MKEIDTLNRYMVCSAQNGVAIMRPPSGAIPKEHALALAAWLVAMVDVENEFPKYLEAVRET